MRRASEGGEDKRKEKKKKKKSGSIPASEVFPSPLSSLTRLSSFLEWIPICSRRRTAKNEPGIKCAIVIMNAKVHTHPHGSTEA